MTRRPGGEGRQGHNPRGLLPTAGGAAVHLAGIVRPPTAPCACPRHPKAPRALFVNRPHERAFPLRRPLTLVLPARCPRPWASSTTTRPRGRVIVIPWPPRAFFVSCKPSRPVLVRRPPPWAYPVSLPVPAGMSSSSHGPRGLSRPPPAHAGLAGPLPAPMDVLNNHPPPLGFLVSLQHLQGCLVHRQPPPTFLLGFRSCLVLLVLIDFLLSFLFFNLTFKTNLFGFCF